MRFKAQHSRVHSKSWRDHLGGPVKVNQKFSFSIFGCFNISFETEFWQPNFETWGLKPQKNSFFNFQFYFSAIADFILWFCTSLSSETWSLILFLSNCFSMLIGFVVYFELNFYCIAYKNQSRNWFLKTKTPVCQTWTFKIQVQINRGSVSW